MSVAMEAVRETDASLRGGDLLHRRHPRSEAAQVLARSITSRWRGSWSGWARTSWHQGHGGPVQAVRGRQAGQGAARGGRAADPFPHARHQRHQRGVASCGRATRAWTSPTARVASMSGTTSQPNLNSIVAALAHTPRDTRLDLERSTSSPNTGRRCASSTSRSTPAPKPGTPRFTSTRCPAASTPTCGSRPSAWALGDRWPEIARDVCRGEPALRRHREGDAVAARSSATWRCFMVTNNLTPTDVLRPEPELAFPRSVVEMIAGPLGPAEGGWPEEAAEASCSGGRKPITGRPGASLPAADFDEDAGRSSSRSIRREATSTT